MKQKTSTATVCQLAEKGRLISRYEVVESYGSGAPKIGTRGTWLELKDTYHNTYFSLNTAVFIDFNTGKRIN